MPDQPRRKVLRRGYHCTRPGRDHVLEPARAPAEALGVLHVELARVVEERLPAWPERERQRGLEPSLEVLPFGQLSGSDAEGFRWRRPRRGRRENTESSPNA